MTATFCSLPLKHFALSLQQKRIRKKLKTSKDITHESSIFEENLEGVKARSVQKHNQSHLLK